MATAISVNLTACAADGKTTTRNFPCVNENASDESVKAFFKSLNSLSTDSIKKLEKVKRTTLQLPTI